MDPLPDIYPLTSLQIGDMQSYISRAFLYFAPVSKKVLILVDNQPWMTGKQSRSARLWQFMITKNSRSGTDTAAAMATTDKRKITTAMRRWLAVANSTPALLHGFLVFEVSWRDVHGINYYNDLLTDTSLALEARYLNKWEFYSAEQAAGCVSQWFLGRASETHSLHGYLLYYHHYHHRPRHHRSSAASTGEEEHARDDVMMMAASSSGDERCTPRAATLRRRMSWRSRARRKNLQQQQYTDRQDQEEEEKEEEDEGLRVPMHMHMHMHMQQYRYNDTLLLFRSRDAALPFKLRQIITSDIRLLTLLESGLPSWVIFLQSYPVLCHMYRPWMRPLARSLYVLASLVTVIIGFYDLYKNVPLLKSAAARICGPLFEWIETWDMVTRIQYLGTILFLRNLRKFMQGLLTLLQAARALLRVMLAPLADLGLCQLLATLGVLASHAWGLVVDLAEVVWAPFDVVLDCVARVVSSLWPVLKVVVLPARFLVAVAACAGSVLSNSYNFFKDIWETLSSIFELNHMSEAQQSAFDMTTLKTLWNDLFSQIFRAIRGILNGILVFFYACNRHRLSIYNHAQTRLRNMLRVTRLAPKQHAPCHCNSTTKHPNHEVHSCIK
ncbi:unnamed protein product [Triticum turgidum subsp. durum]|uniref:Uncharacterized protein n=1 Tax=Triticum turgidum subsp. durum TaxID=4567 RepID=A0A9R0VE92_TRITD|nr:unnamed protein product [Triticum turgidum subsp. durum]